MIALLLLFSCQVAVKVQRPDVREQVTLDLFVVRQIASIGRVWWVTSFATAVLGIRAGCVVVVVVVVVVVWHVFFICGELTFIFVVFFKS